MSDTLTIADRTFTSRLFVGTGKYPSHPVMAQCHAASGAEVVTVAVRRVDLSDKSGTSLMDYIAPSLFILPNTAACYTAADAIRTARLGREAGLSNWVKLEVIGDERTLLPDNEALSRPRGCWSRKGSWCCRTRPTTRSRAASWKMPGAAAVMPLGAPIGSGLGIQNPNNISIIKEFAKVPVVVDAGVGTASDVAIAMELGADAVLLNTAIAAADQPVLMAEAMKHAVAAGRLAFLAGRMPKRRYASASSPLDRHDSRRVARIIGRACPTSASPARSTRHISHASRPRARRPTPPTTPRCRRWMPRSPAPPDDAASVGGARRVAGHARSTSSSRRRRPAAARRAQGTPAPSASGRSWHRCLRARKRSMPRSSITSTATSPPDGRSATARSR